ncbi:hypothetical protein HK099_005281, partial [Clydaea vesicula]
RKMTTTSTNKNAQLAQQYLKQRKSLEDEIISLSNVLKSQNVGMTEPLTDSENFPRADIDVYTVRITRNKIICLQNDIKNLNLKIEKALITFHEEEKLK